MEYSIAVIVAALALVLSLAYIGSRIGQWYSDSCPPARSTAFPTTISASTESTSCEGARQQDVLSSFNGSARDAVTSFNGTARDVSRQHLGRCALIGSGIGLRGKRLGNEIDSHDTVIRINRLPAPDMACDLGQRSDVLVARLLSLHDCSTYRTSVLTRPTSKTSRHGLSNAVAATTCHFRGTRSCPYRLLVLVPPRSAGFFLNGRDFPRGDPGCVLRCTAPGLNCAAVPAALVHAAHQLRGLRSNGMRPAQELTAGLLAFLTLAPLCTAVRLYGFGGSGNIDGHLLNEQLHSYAAEHALLYNLSGGIVDGLHLHVGRGAAPVGGEMLQHEARLARLRCTLQRQAASGLLQIVRTDER